MNYLPSVIETKFIPPYLKETVVARPSLMKKLIRIKNYPLTIIHSGPGYGKSTSLALLLNGSSIPFCWYTVSEQDDNFFPFVVSMVYCVRTLFPDFGAELLSILEQEDSLDYDQEKVEFTCSKFINEIKSIHKEFIFVLDDFHLLDRSEWISRWMRLFVLYKPANVHLVISSRVRPSWDILETMKLKGEVLEITEKDLVFSKEEIGVLFSDYYLIPLGWETVEQIYTITEGWIIAIQMIWQQMKMEPHYSFFSTQLTSMDDLFRFLASEVFFKQPEVVRDFLERTSVFEEFSESVCHLWFSEEDIRYILDYLMRQNLFINPIGEGQYRYHALFREFLQSQIRKKTDVFYHTHQQAADYSIRWRNYEKAILHLLAIKEYERIAVILQHNGRSMLEEGKIETLLKVVRQIPEHVKDRYSMLWFYEGEMYRYRSQYEEALDCYRRVERHAEITNDKIGMSLGVEGQARVYLDTVQPSKADPLLRKAVLLLDHPSPDWLDGNERKRSLYALMAENLLNMGNTADAEKWYLQTKSFEYGEKHLKMIELEARLYLRTGRLRRAKEILKNYSEKQNEQRYLSRAHRTSEILLALLCVYMGEVEEAKRLAESGILQGTKWKAPFVEACGWMRKGHALQLNDVYEQQMAIQCYETAVSMMDDMNIPRGKAEPWMGLCLLYGRSGCYDLAVECGMRALSETESVKDIWLSSFILLALGIASYYGGDIQKARQMFYQCLSAFRQCGCQYGLMVSYFWISLLEFEQKNERLFHSFFEQCLRLIEEQDYSFFIEKKTLFGPNDLQTIVPMLIKVKKQESTKHIANRLLERLGMKDVSFHPGYALKVKTLGEFRLFLGQKEVSERDWKREKAKELFQLFITFRGQLLPRDNILSLLWKDSHEAAAERDFKVALNALNKVIEPGRKARSQSFFIERRGSLYGLNGRAVIELDAVQFQTLIEKGLEEKDKDKAAEMLTQGLKLYRGDYLPDRFYADWCAEERDRLLLLFLKGAERLAQINVSKEQFDEAIYWCDQILAKDRCWEEAYRLLMYSYYRKNNRTYAVKLYQKCCEQLKKELGVEPLETTKQMFEMITMN
ncbi:BTAD domain-containing putative transcriptional regulator [Geobacillus subterraneus]|uniref:BTAD domain-containing putative transcriptional regulator n=1 Tax=Geobacillus subterraneus TaxID=129338 RepID=UPI0016137BC2